MKNVEFKMAKVRNVDLMNGALYNVSFESADLTQTKFKGSRLTEVKFHNARLPHADFTNCPEYDLKEIRKAITLHEAIMPNGKPFDSEIGDKSGYDQKNNRQ
jgi:uncharacterized protein YjbI with pentapeptide repeats